MRCQRLYVLVSVAAVLCFPVGAFAGKSLADYPLRVHIMFRNGVRHYYGMGAGIHTLEGVDGLGKGNLFQNGQPQGFDFNYECAQPITPQSVFETFPARWKKQGRELEIIYPRMGGKPGDMYACDLKVNMTRGTAYVRRAGALVEEPSDEYKQWMTVHQYDPEHGKDQPVGLPSARSAGNGPPAD